MEHHSASNVFASTCSVFFCWCRMCCPTTLRCPNGSPLKTTQSLLPISSSCVENTDFWVECCCMKGRLQCKRHPPIQPFCSHTHALPYVKRSLRMKRSTNLASSCWVSIVKFGRRFHSTFYHHHGVSKRSKSRLDLRWWWREAYPTCYLNILSELFPFP